MLQAYKRNGKKLPSGLEFEAHVFPQLQQLETQPLTEDSSKVHRMLYGGKVYQAGAGVPLMLLVRSRYKPRDESEAKELARKDRERVVTAEGWREKLVDLDDQGGFRFVLAPQPTPASRALAPHIITEDGEDTVEVAPGALALAVCRRRQRQPPRVSRRDPPE